MPLNQQDLEVFAERLGQSMARAQVEALQSTDALTKVKKGAANMTLSAAGALVAFVLLSWAQEYRDQSKKALEDAKSAQKVAEEAAVTAQANYENTITALESCSKLEALIAPLTEKVAEMAAIQQRSGVTGAPNAPLPAEAIQAERDALLKAQDKALYRSMQRNAPAK